MAKNILVIDDEDSICLAFQRFFARRHWVVRIASSATQGVSAFTDERPDVVFLDVRLPDGDGLEVLGRLREIDASVPVIIITAYGGFRTVIGSMAGEAFDYLPKPIDLDQAEELTRRAVAGTRRKSPSETQRDAGADVGERTELVGSSVEMQRVFKRIAVLSQSDSSVLVLGATGTGKEVVARAIHHHSGRTDAPFVAVNCGALPENLVESELFGHVRGAFTGADADRIGKFEAADGGTLFLDEVGELPAPAQVKLLRALDSQTIERVGSTESRKLDVRIIAATNRGLPGDVEAGRFRADLYYRLAVVQVELPILADRPADILPLAEHFLALEAPRSQSTPRLDDEARRALLGYGWPGNVRELRNAMAHAAALTPGDSITPADLPDAVSAQTPSPAPAGGRLGGIIEQYLGSLPAADGDLYAQAVRPLEEALLRHAMARCGANQSEAAELLGLHRNTVRKKLRDLGLDEMGRRPAQ